MFSIVKHFFRAQRGNVAVVAALMTPVMIMVVGIAMDTGNMVGRRSHLQEAADNATLAVAAQIATTNDQTPTTAEYRALVQATLAADSQGKDVVPSIAEFHICTPAGRDCSSTGNANHGEDGNNGNDLTAGQIYLKVTSSSPRYLSQIIPVTIGTSQSSVPLEAVSTSVIPGASYIDIYVMVDVSASMGLGASASDQASMTASMGCAFACHNQNTGVANTVQNDSVLRAHANGYKLRIDAIKHALTTVVGEAQAAMGVNPVHIRFGIYTFSDNFSTVLDLSSAYGTTSDTGTNTIYGAINALDVAQIHSGTNTYYAMQKMRDIVKHSGDGTSQSQAKTFVFFASDGTVNTTDNAGGYFYVDSKWNGQLPNSYIQYQFTQTSGPAVQANLQCPKYQQYENDLYDADPQAMFADAPVPCVAQPYWSGFYNTVTGKHGGSVVDFMYIQPVQTAWCDLIKQKGANMMTLYTTYDSPAPPQEPYTNYVHYAVAPKIQANMQTCASMPGYAFVASDTNGIDSSMHNMFALALGTTRITS